MESVLTLFCYVLCDILIGEDSKDEKGKSKIYYSDFQ